MRLSLIWCVGVLGLSALAMVSAARAQDPSGAPGLPPGRPEPPGRLDKVERRKLLRQQEEPRDLEEFRQRQKLDSERVDRAQKTMQDKFQQWQSRRDRPSYRQWRAAYLDWLDAQRHRDDAASQFARRWQREHPGVPVPSTPGIADAAPSYRLATPDRPQRLPAPWPFRPMLTPPLPEPADGPRLPEPTDGPKLPEPIPTPPSLPLPPGEISGSREL